MMRCVSGCGRALRICLAFHSARSGDGMLDCSDGHGFKCGLLMMVSFQWLAMVAMTAIAAITSESASSALNSWTIWADSVASKGRRKHGLMIRPCHLPIS
jgi:hypothetical protein